MFIASKLSQAREKALRLFPDILEEPYSVDQREEQKSEVEPLKIWGRIGPDGIVPADGPRIKAKCVRVAVLHGHTAYVSIKFKSSPTTDQILERWEDYNSPDKLPSAPGKLIHYLPEADRPQPKLDVMTEKGMAVTLGQLKVDDDGIVSFTGLSHNLILGAAGGAVLATEAAIARQLVYRRIDKS